MNLGYEGHELTPYVEPVVDKNNELRIQRMLEMGFTRKEIQESLSENSYDEVCATYYLLAKEVLRSREVSHLAIVMPSLLDMVASLFVIIMQTSTSSLLAGTPTKPMSNGDLNSDTDNLPSALSQDSSLPHPTAGKKMSAPVTPVGGAQQHPRYTGRSFSLRQPASTRRQSDTPLAAWCVAFPTPAPCAVRYICAICN